MRRQIIRIAVPVLLAAALGAGMFFLRPGAQVVTVDRTLLKDVTTTDPALFKQAYPKHYASYLKNQQEDPPALKYGGSVPVSHLDAYPWLKTLMAGMPFSKEYNEDRGHTATLDDLSATDRIGPATTASCLYCKSAEVPRLLQQYGDGFYKTPLSQVSAQASHPITCSDCHEPGSMTLRITRPALTEAMARRGADISRATQEEMKSLTCAQCHVEYFFNPKEGGKVTFPWERGFDPAEIYAYYEAEGFADWTHPVSGAKMLKAQHPEFELFQGSTHQANGLSCASCHMPVVQEGGAKIVSHWWTSPLRTMAEGCGSCHTQGAEYLKERVLYTQERVSNQANLVGKALERAHRKIGEASVHSWLHPSKLDAARALVREGQFYWDYVTADNSMGFHNPQKSLETLSRALDLALRAQISVQDALLTSR